MRTITTQHLSIEVFDENVWSQERNLMKVSCSGASYADTIQVTYGTKVFNYRFKADGTLSLDCSDFIRSAASGSFYVDYGTDSTATITWTVQGLINPDNMIIPQNASGTDGVIINPSMILRPFDGCALRLEAYLSSFSGCEVLSDIARSMVRSNVINDIATRVQYIFATSAASDIWSYHYVDQFVVGGDEQVSYDEAEPPTWVKVKYTEDTELRVYFNSETVGTAHVTTTKKSLAFSVNAKSAVTSWGISHANATGHWNIYTHRYDLASGYFYTLKFDAQVTDIDTNEITFDNFSLEKKSVADTRESQLTEPCGLHAMLQWTSRSGAKKIATWLLKSDTQEAVNAVDLQCLGNEFDIKKGQEWSITAYLEGLTAYDYWYYSDIVTSSDVRMLLNASGFDTTNNEIPSDYRVKVTTKNVKQPDGDTKFYTLEVQITYKRYDTV